MKKIVWALLAMLAIANNESAFGTEHPNCCHRFYLKGFSGVNLIHTTPVGDINYDSKTGFVAGSALGYTFKLLSLEGEFSYRHNSIDHVISGVPNEENVSGDIKQYCGMGNLLFQIPTTVCFFPYAGVGTGYRFLTLDANFDNSSSSSENRLFSMKQWGSAFCQLVGGLNFTPCKLINIQLEYRFLVGFSGMSFNNHTIDMGMVFRF